MKKFRPAGTMKFFRFDPVLKNSRQVSNFLDTFPGKEETPPYATNVEITGTPTEVIVGQTLVGTYGYNHIDGTPEGPTETFWSTETSVIALGSTLLITEAHIGHTIRFAVVPVSTAITNNTGQVFYSAPTPAVIAAGVEPDPPVEPDPTDPPVDPPVDPPDPPTPSVGIETARFEVISAEATPTTMSHTGAGISIFEAPAPLRIEIQKISDTQEYYRAMAYLDRLPNATPFLYNELALYLPDGYVPVHHFTSDLFPDGTIDAGDGTRRISTVDGLTKYLWVGPSDRQLRHALVSTAQQPLQTSGSHVMKGKMTLAIIFKHVSEGPLGVYEDTFDDACEQLKHFMMETSFSSGATGHRKIDSIRGLFTSDGNDEGVVNDLGAVARRNFTLYPGNTDGYPTWMALGATLESGGDFGGTNGQYEPCFYWMRQAFFAGDVHALEILHRQMHRIIGMGFKRFGSTGPPVSGWALSYAQNQGAGACGVPWKRNVGGNTRNHLYTDNDTTMSHAFTADIIFYALFTRDPLAIECVHNIYDRIVAPGFSLWLWSPWAPSGAPYDPEASTPQSSDFRALDRHLETLIALYLVTGPGAKRTAIAAQMSAVINYIFTQIPEGVLGFFNNGFLSCLNPQSYAYIQAWMAIEVLWRMIQVSDLIGIGSTQRQWIVDSIKWLIDSCWSEVGDDVFIVDEFNPICETFRDNLHAESWWFRSAWVYAKKVDPTYKHLVYKALMTWMNRLADFPLPNIRFLVATTPWKNLAQWNMGLARDVVQEILTWDEPEAGSASPAPKSFGVFPDDYVPTATIL